MIMTPEEYVMMIEQAPIMIWRSDITGKCDYFNQRWLDFTGRRLEQEIGTGWVESVHPEDLDERLQFSCGSLYHKRIFEIEYRLRRHDGVYRWVLDRGVRLKDRNGYFQGYLGSCIDVTEKKEAQLALKRAQDQEINYLRGLIPICAECKSVRNDQGFWQQVEEYIREHSEADFSHGICPDCLDRVMAGMEKESYSLPKK
ncbi:MAG: PAS domain-containing protein [Desulfovibrionales bacterium]